MLSRALTAAILALLLLPVTAAAGTFSKQGNTIVYDSNGGEDKVAVYDVGNVIRLVRFGQASLGPGAACTFSAQDEAVDCPKAGVNSVILNLGDGDDVGSVSGNVSLPVIFNGGDGADGLFGGGGTDVFDGGAGDDNIVSRDNRGEQVDCGAGHDTAISDDADTRGSCEEIEGDADGDGVRRPADCDDTNPAIRPGAADVPDDRIDQDCSGADATNLDRDGDGSPRPQDCDDDNARIRPGAREIIGNRTDENCDTEAVAFRGLGGLVRNLWLPAAGGTRNGLLTVTKVPRRTRIDLRCSGRGCPFRRVKRRFSGGSLRLHRFFGDRVLGSGARVELRLTRGGRIGRVLAFRMTSTPGVPSVAFRCKPPGRRVRDC